ncbi:MAG: CAAX prenyl protease-related protein [Bryobacteraceae bacterium]|nr:CAAX prenyl protease-related protein [Bryobacteraceae bacterium]
METAEAHEPKVLTESTSSVPYVLPFVLFLGLLALAPQFSAVLGQWEYPSRAAILALTLVVVSRHVIDFRMQTPLIAILVGIGVFFLWIGPDFLIPGYRNHWLFQNSLTGQIKPGIAPDFQNNWLVLAARSLRAIVLVPIIEELFWRAWLMRWLIDPKFYRVSLGTFTWSSMLITAFLFGSEHGPYWDVGLLTGLIYNFLMVRSKRLGDCILAHSVTNACLSAYVVLYNRWEYWP